MMLSVLARRGFRSLVLAGVALGLSACVADNKRVKTGGASVLAGISAVDNADAIMQMPVLFSFVNNGAEPVELLKWNTPLEKVLSADVFKVTIDGESVEYVGRTMKRASPGAGDFVVLDAGARTEALIDISRYYDTSRAGAYEVQFHPPGAENGYINNGVAVALDSGSITLIRN